MTVNGAEESLNSIALIKPHEKGEENRLTFHWYADEMFLKISLHSALEILVNVPK